MLIVLAVIALTAPDQLLFAPAYSFSYTFQSFMLS
jgi:hypothetical protein